MLTTASQWYPQLIYQSIEQVDQWKNCYTVPHFPPISMLWHKIGIILSVSLFFSVIFSDSLISLCSIFIFLSTFVIYLYIFVIYFCRKDESKNIRLTSTSFHPSSFCRSLYNMKINSQWFFFFFFFFNLCVWFISHVGLGESWGHVSRSTSLDGVSQELGSHLLQVHAVALRDAWYVNYNSKN